VAFAGVTTNASAVLLTVFEVAATGKAIRNSAEPTIVATKQAGRPRTASMATAPPLGLSCAEAGEQASNSVTVQSIVTVVFMSA
jgi:hypothetical protein